MSVQSGTIRRRVPAEPQIAGPSGERKTRIVIVGGGAGGLELATRLGARLGRRRCEVVLVDRNPTHIWKPLLHEVATGSLDTNLDEVSYRGHSRRWGYRFVLGAMETVDRKARELVVAPLLNEKGHEVVERHRISYDYLVIAIGSEANDFGTPGVQEHCMLLDSRADADRFRDRFLKHCLRVSRAMSAALPREQFVNIAIAGAGATGVELAAELYNAAAGLRHYRLEVFDETRLNVTLIEAAPRILPALHEKLSAAAKAELEKLAVSVLTSTRIVAAEADGFVTADGRHIHAGIMLWVAGVKAPAILGEIDGLDIDRNGQMLGALLLGALGVWKTGGASRVWLYWLVVAIARTSGTAMGDFLAESDALSIGLPVATLITGTAFALVLILWPRGEKAKLAHAI